MTKEWIEWKGGECPVPTGTLVDVKHRDGDWGIAKEAGRFNTGKGPGAAVHWDHSDSDGDIIAWRLHQPEPTAWNGEGLPPVGREAERQREEVIDSIANLCHRGDPGDDATSIYNAIAAGNIPGVKLDS